MMNTLFCRMCKYTLPVSHLTPCPLCAPFMPHTYVSLTHLHTFMPLTIQRAFMHLSNQHTFMLLTTWPAFMSLTCRCAPTSNVHPCPLPIQCAPMSATHLMCIHVCYPLTCTHVLYHPTCVQHHIMCHYPRPHIIFHHPPHHTFISVILWMCAYAPYHKLHWSSLHVNVLSCSLYLTCRTFTSPDTPHHPDFMTSLWSLTSNLMYLVTLHTISLLHLPFRTPYITLLVFRKSHSHALHSAHLPN